MSPTEPEEPLRPAPGAAAGEPDAGEPDAGASEAGAPEADAQEADAQVAAATPESVSEEGERFRRDRRTPLVITLASVAGVLIVVLVALLLLPRDTRDPFTVITITETEPVPTPESEPIDRDTSTPLLAALPDTVLGYAVSDQAPADYFVDERDALEAWTLTYTSAEGDVELTVAQWPTSKEAYQVWNAMSAPDDAGPPAAAADIVIDGETVGGMRLLELSVDSERTVWRNGTACFRLDGPAGATQAFYDAFGL